VRHQQARSWAQQGDGSFPDQSTAETNSPQVTVSALLVSASRNDAALEQIIGRMSLERFVTAAHWQAEQAPAEN
jgi:putative Mg2+ transporter-C (MgtC) family protein